MNSDSPKSFEKDLADTLNRETDPLASHEREFDKYPAEEFYETFYQNRLTNWDDAESTEEGYHRVWNQWVDFMRTAVDRHPCLPSSEHTKRFAEQRAHMHGNSFETVNEKLRKLETIYQYWTDKPAYPHSDDYRPFRVARQEASLPSSEDPKKPPRIEIDELGNLVRREVKHIRDRAIIVLQLKLGARASEITNIRLEDIHLQNSEIQSHYDRLGNNISQLEERKQIALQNCILIPHDRKRNKSKRPRLLPLDDELRKVLISYLLIRPDVDEPWLILSKTTHEKTTKQAINQTWKDGFHPKFSETDEHDSVTSHYGRHRFTTYWRVEQDLNRELIKYMRGDTAGSSSIEERGAIDEYLHTYYEDIQDVYLEQIFKLGL